MVLLPQALECQTFFDACFRQRVDPGKFRALFTTFYDGHDVLPSKTILDALFKQNLSSGTRDPRLPQYTRELLRLRVVGLADVLCRLLPPSPQDSVNGHTSHHDQNLLEVTGTAKPTFEAMIFQMLTIEVSEGTLMSAHEAQMVLKALIPWMSRYPGSTSLGYFVSAVLGTGVGQEILAQAPRGDGHLAIAKPSTLLTCTNSLEETVWICP